MITPDQITKIKKNPTAKDVQAEIDRLGYSQSELSELLHIDPRTLRRYLQARGTDGATPIPFPTFALLRLLRPE